MTWCNRIKSDFNSWHACIKIDPITHTVTNPGGESGSGASSDFLDASESHTPLSGSIRIETSLFRKWVLCICMPLGRVPCPLPSSWARQLLSQRIRCIVFSSTKETFYKSWAPCHKYFMYIGYSSSMMGKLIQKIPYSKRADLLTAMDDKAARRLYFVG